MIRCFLLFSFEHSSAVLHFGSSWFQSDSSTEVALRLGISVRPHKGHKYKQARQVHMKRNRSVGLPRELTNSVASITDVLLTEIF
jgi:hypothetical protein